MLRWLVPLVLLVPAFAQAPSSVAVPTTAPPAAGDVPVGKAELAVDAGPVRLQVFTYRPANWSGQRLLFVMHGVLRNADEYRDHAVGMADRFDALVVAPKFDSERFPRTARRRHPRSGPTRAFPSWRRPCARAPASPTRSCSSSATPPAASSSCA
jgi:hypothetical protein